MPNIKEVRDEGAFTIEELWKSQRKGAEGTGFDVTYDDKMSARNHGTGLGEGKETKFAEAEAGVDVESALPWE